MANIRDMGKGLSSPRGGFGNPFGRGGAKPGKPAKPAKPSTSRSSKPKPSNRATTKAGAASSARSTAQAKKYTKPRSTSKTPAWADPKSPSYHGKGNTKITISKKDIAQTKRLQAMIGKNKPALSNRAKAGVGAAAGIGVAAGAVGTAKRLGSEGPKKGGTNLPKGTKYKGAVWNGNKWVTKK